MANSTTYTYVSDTKLKYYTEKLKEKLLSAENLIDDTTSTGDKVTWSAKKIAEEFAKVTSVEIQKVTALPAIGKTGVFYLLPNSGIKPNVYDEYIWSAANTISYEVATSVSNGTVTIDPTAAAAKITDEGVITLTYDGSDWLDDDGGIVALADYGVTFTDTDGVLASLDTITITAAKGQFEKLGTTEIDLTGYVKEEQLVEITETQIDNIFTAVWPAPTTPTT